jgi:pyruvate-ferredoxin/flavodoxin oxidoreductase
MRITAPRSSLTVPFGPEEVWDNLPRELQKQILDKNIKLYIIDAYKVAKDTGMGVRINTIMQTCFFAISGVLPREEAIERIKESIRHSYGKRGEAVVQQNFAAVDHTLAHLDQVDYPQGRSRAGSPCRPLFPAEAPEFVQNVTAEIMAGRGEELPVSAFPLDGTWPSCDDAVGEA